MVLRRSSTSQRQMRHTRFTVWSQLHDNLQATESQLLSNTNWRISSVHVSLLKSSSCLVGSKHRSELEALWAASCQAHISHMGWGWGQPRRQPMGREWVAACPEVKGGTQKEAQGTIPGSNQRLQRVQAPPCT